MRGLHKEPLKSTVAIRHWVDVYNKDRKAN